MSAFQPRLATATAWRHLQLYVPSVSPCDFHAAMWFANVMVPLVRFCWRTERYWWKVEVPWIDGALVRVVS